jgi:hypothetical protein
LFSTRSLKEKRQAKTSSTLGEHFEMVHDFNAVRIVPLFLYDFVYMWMI